MNSADHCLKLAWSYISDVEQELEGFSSAASSYSSRVENDELGFGQSMKGLMKIGREKNRLLKELSLAEQQISEGQSIDPEARVEVDAEGETLELDHQGLRSICACDAAILHATSGDYRQAEKELQRAIELKESSFYHHLLGQIHLEKKRPREARDAFSKAVEIGNGDRYDIESRKEIGRLESKRVLGDHWFVGSWKIALILIALSLLSIPMMLSTGEYMEGALSFCLWASILAIYMKIKIR